MSAQTIRGADWSAGVLDGLDASEVSYGAQCATCTKSSGQSRGDRRPVGAWAVQHTRAHPTHRDYVQITRERYHVHPTSQTTPTAPDSAPAQADGGFAPAPLDDGQPHPIDHDGDRPRKRHTRHARPLPAWRLVVWAAVWGVGVRVRRGCSGVARGGAWLWRCVTAWAGPLFLALLAAALGFFLGAVLLQGAVGHG